MSAIEPFYFGANEALFGIYHPASGTPRNRAVLIAGPMLNEYMRSHHAIRQCAIQLAANGFDVLRFDYQGMGNSAGQLADRSLSDFADDIVAAADELRSLSGQQRLSLVAVRFGAALSSRLGDSAEIDTAVFWDPIFVGADWLAELRLTQRQEEEKHGPGLFDPDLEFQGHEVSSRFVQELSCFSAGPFDAGRRIAIATRPISVAGAVDSSFEDSIEVDFDCRWSTLTSQVIFAHEVVDKICSSMA